MVKVLCQPIKADTGRDTELVGIKATKLSTPPTLIPVIPSGGLFQNNLRLLQWRNSISDKRLSRIALRDPGLRCGSAHPQIMGRAIPTSRTHRQAPSSA